VLPNEKQEIFDALLAELREEHQPCSITEELLVLRMAQHHWLSNRARNLVQAAIDADDIPFKELIPEVNLWMRYETSNQRAFHKCLSDLLKLNAEKRKMRVAEENGFERQNANKLPTRLLGQALDLSGEQRQWALQGMRPRFVSEPNIQNSASNGKNVKPPSNRCRRPSPSVNSGPKSKPKFPRPLRRAPNIKTRLPQY
jgi:hypothetical protein